MTAVKKIPQRLCIGCQTVHPKKELIRIVRSPEGDFSVDRIIPDCVRDTINRTGKKSGRGAYVCDKIECFDAAVKAHRFQKSFQGEIGADVLKVLREQFEQGKKDEG